MPMKKLIVILLVLLPLFMKAQIITTFAGGGTSGIGDGGPATAAVIADPNGSTFDGSGNFYLASCLGGNRIRKVNNAGIITTVVGSHTGGFCGDNGAATSACLYGPVDVILDSAGNLYIADAQNFRIRKVNAATGIITTIGGTGVDGFNGDSIAATNAQIFPTDLCIDSKGNIYVADRDSYRIRKIDTSGIITTIAGIGGFGSTGDGGLATDAQLVPNSIAMDDTGNIYVGDEVNSNIRKIDTTGIITTFAGNGTALYSTDGIPATAASFEPESIRLDHQHNMYISDSYNEIILQIDTAGILHRVAGTGAMGFSGDGGPATAATFSYPNHVSIDACDNVYVSEANNVRIRKITFNPTCSMLSLNVVECTKEPINIYPNPTNDKLQIDNIAKPTSYKLHNIVGTTLQHGTLKEGNNSISLSALPTGMYLLELIDDEGHRVVRKVVKE